MLSHQYESCVSSKNIYNNIILQQEGSVISSHLLKPQTTATAPDMSPFFLKQYVKTHAHDVFEEYVQLITEVALRVPLQVRSTCPSSYTITKLTCTAEF